MREELSADNAFRSRFLHEARAAQHVHHTHLVPIVEAGEAHGLPFLAAEYISGQSLQAEIGEKGALSTRAVARLIAQVGSALDALHAEGLIHRDVKPSNILIDAEGRPSLTDFGLAKGPAYTVLTRPGQVLGTLDYLAPEVIRGQSATAASDIYALGCVAYESATGRPPFAAAKGMFQLAMAHLELPPPGPRLADRDLPNSFSSALLSALAKGANDRPMTGLAYANMLKVGAGRG
jgi:serine/threonine-protein kinase